MTWGEIQIEALRKMFLNNDIIVIDKIAEYKKDKKYKTYLDAMPQAFNEAVNIILETRPIINVYELNFSDVNYFEMKKVIPNFKRFYDVVYIGNHKPNFKLIGDNIFVVDHWNEEEGKFLIYYESFIDRVITSTEDNKKIDLDMQLCSLIPLYLAGELYKDDDLSLATMYMNEFLTNLQSLENKDINYSPNSIETVYSIYV